MGPQTYGKNETQRFVDSAAIISVFSFLYMPRYGLDEYTKQRTSTKMRQRFVEYWPSKSLSPPV